MLQFSLHQSCYYFNNADSTHVVLDLLKITTIFQTLPYQITTNLIEMARWDHKANLIEMAQWDHKANLIEMARWDHKARWGSFCKKKEITAAIADWNGF
jgi:hypothetical protein